jgi:hypothetical protein
VYPFKSGIRTHKAIMDFMGDLGMSEVLVNLDGVLCRFPYCPAERKRKRDDSVGSDRKRKGKVKYYHST